MMEVQLRELIDQIKKDGVQAAEAQAEAILTAAKEQADKIVADAQEQADKLLQNAKTETERTVRSGEDAIRQAGRNLLLSFREGVNKELQAILGKAVSDVYSSESLAQLIVTAIECWAAKSDADDLSVILNSDDLQAFEGTVLAALKAKMLSGVTLKAGDSFHGGFRIAADGGNVYYDYSAEAVVEMLSAYLSPKVAELLKEA